MYLIYLKDYKDIEQEKPANVPQAWCEEPLTKLDALPAPLRAGGGDTTPLSYQISISGENTERAQTGAEQGRIDVPSQTATETPLNPPKLK